MKKVGILSLQGDVSEHEKALAKLSHESVRVLNADQIKDLTHLILPGGESTTMSLLLREPEGQKLKKAVQEQAQSGDLAVFGTCAGAILLASEVISSKPIENMKLIDAKLDRNAYGSQLHSFETLLEFLPSKEQIEGVFIRAPKIASYGEDVEVLIKHQKDPVMLRQGRVLLSTFHPEYNDPPVAHEYFLRM